MKRFLELLGLVFTNVLPAVIISLLFIAYTPLYLIIQCFKLFHYDSSYSYSTLDIFEEYREVWKRIWDI